jgi:hypothetical protein
VNSQEKYMPSAKSILISCAGALLGSSLHAADIGNDLKATIVLQGLTCDQVAQRTRNGDSDYNVSCKDGNRYHVFVNAQGRVVVQKLK